MTVVTLTEPSCHIQNVRSVFCFQNIEAARVTWQKRQHGHELGEFSNYLQYSHMGSIRQYMDFVQDTKSTLAGWSLVLIYGTSGLCLDKFRVPVHIWNRLKWCPEVTPAVTLRFNSSTNFTEHSVTGSVSPLRCIPRGSNLVTPALTPF